MTAVAGGPVSCAWEPPPNYMRGRLDRSRRATRVNPIPWTLHRRRADDRGPTILICSAFLVRLRPCVVGDPSQPDYASKPIASLNALPQFREGRRGPNRGLTGSNERGRLWVMEPSASGGQAESTPSANTNLCPTCRENQKTSWSKSCQTCEGNRQRYIAAISRAESDKQFLQRLRETTQTAIAKELHVSRQRVNQLKQDAERRVAFLSQPLPPIPTTPVQ